MKAPTKERWFKFTVWVTAEILLVLTGLDDLAAYGEFVLGDQEIPTLNGVILS
jgi:hypothetical protein